MHFKNILKEQSTERHRNFNSFDSDESIQLKSFVSSHSTIDDYSEILYKSRELSTVSGLTTYSIVQGEDADKCPSVPIFPPLSEAAILISGEKPERFLDAGIQFPKHSDVTAAGRIIKDVPIIRADSVTCKDGHRSTLQYFTVPEEKDMNAYNISKNIIKKSLNVAEFEISKFVTTKQALPGEKFDNWSLPFFDDTSSISSFPLDQKGIKKALSHQEKMKQESRQSEHSDESREPTDKCGDQTFDPKYFVEAKPLNWEDLDYGLIVNCFEGNWATNEDLFINQIYYKFIFDRAFRERLQKNCHSFCDECQCEFHEPITNEYLKNLTKSDYFEIETEKDENEVVSRLQQEFKAAHEKDINADFEKMIEDETDSDEEEDSYYSPADAEEKLEFVKSMNDFTKPKPPCPGKHRSEEDFLRRRAYPSPDTPLKIQRLRYKDLVKNSEKKNIGEVVQSLYDKKEWEFRNNEERGIWRPYEIYHYKQPIWKPRSKKPKKDFQFVNKMDEVIKIA